MKKLLLTLSFLSFGAYLSSSSQVGGLIQKVQGSTSLSDLSELIAEFHQYRSALDSECYNSIAREINKKGIELEFGQIKSVQYLKKRLKDALCNPDFENLDALIKRCVIKQLKEICGIVIEDEELLDLYLCNENTGRNTGIAFFPIQNSCWIYEPGDDFSDFLTRIDGAKTLEEIKKLKDECVQRGNGHQHQKGNEQFFEQRIFYNIDDAFKRQTNLIKRQKLAEESIFCRLLFSLEDVKTFDALNNWTIEVRSKKEQLTKSEKDTLTEKWRLKKKKLAWLCS